MKFNLLTYSYVTSLYKFLSIVFLHQSHLIFYFCIILYTVTVYSILTLLFQLLMKTSFVQSNYWANKFVNLSSPISLAFNFKCYFILLILIYNNQLSLTAVCPSSPCKNCSLAITMPIVSLCSTAREHARGNIVSLVCSVRSVYSVRGNGVFSSFYFPEGTGHYLCRGGRGGREIHVGKITISVRPPLQTM